MKKIIYYSLILVSFQVLSQGKIDRTLGDFSKVAVYDGINLELIKSDKNKAEISGKNTKYVVVKNKNGDLKIRLNLERRFSGEKTKVKLFYKNVYTIVSHEGSNVFSKDTVEQSDISIKANSGSRQNLIFNVNTLNSVAATGGKIIASGKANYHDSTVSTGAEIDSKKLIANEAYITATTGGVVEVNVLDELELNSKLGGIINVHEKTNKITESISLGGTVNYLEQD